jgi:hypothetical protein
MTIDDRLEALTQTVELLAQMHGQTETSMSQIGKTMNALAEAQVETEKRLSRLGRYAILIARDHEARLSALENGDE